MRIIILLLFAVMANIFTVAAQELKVFDLQLNDSFNIPECPCKVQETATMNGISVKKHKWRGLLGKKPDLSKMYVYTDQEPLKGKCFQRVGMYYTEAPVPGTPGADVLPVPMPPNNQKVKLVYAKEGRPGIADAEDIWAGIQDHKLTGVRFYFNWHNADSVYQVLLRKYGKPASLQGYFISAPMGNKKDYNEAKWNFPRLSVTFLSLDTNQIGYVPGDAPLGYLSEVGSVSIQYKVSSPAKPKDNNKLQP
ncbi:MAG: hypothetical protein U0V75_14550 [Ferruginibacter sp.]